MKPHYEGGVVVVRIKAKTPLRDRIAILRKAKALAAKHSNEYAYYYKKYRG
jgi:hypothetical protein